MFLRGRSDSGRWSHINSAEVAAHFGSFDVRTRSAEFPLGDKNTFQGCYYFLGLGEPVCSRPFFSLSNLVCKFIF